MDTSHQTFLTKDRLMRMGIQTNPTCLLYKQRGIEYTDSVTNYTQEVIMQVHRNLYQQIHNRNAWTKHVLKYKESDRANKHNAYMTMTGISITYGLRGKKKFQTTERPKGNRTHNQISCKYKY